MTVQVSAETSRLTGWFKSSHSSNANACVEVTFAARGQVSVRDSKFGADSAVITVPERHWARLLADVLHGTADNGVVGIEHTVDGGAVLRGNGAELRYTAREWVAFREGVRTGEFHLAAAEVARTENTGTRMAVSGS
ncbi:DUF397 domain-containing protein [Sciscionella sediminilitoris]|uniref:DUF397 domain-containing protein n=1 Tax=Sciscionella sediminilitoris TaxID=1445613 RepID=UPI0018D1428E|nr:DUF397 domain-containing protein [Sciscionella sp. SE31]